MRGSQHRRQAASTHSKAIFIYPNPPANKASDVRPALSVFFAQGCRPIPVATATDEQRAAAQCGI